MAFNYYTSMKV